MWTKQQTEDQILFDNLRYRICSYHYKSTEISLKSKHITYGLQSETNIFIAIKKAFHLLIKKVKGLKKLEEDLN